MSTCVGPLPEEEGNGDARFTQPRTTQLETPIYEFSLFHQNIP